MCLKPQRHRGVWGNSDITPGILKLAVDKREWQTSGFRCPIRSLGKMRVTAALLN